MGVTKLLLLKGAKVNAKDEVRDRTPKREKDRKREKERCVREEEIESALDSPLPFPPWSFLCARNTHPIGRLCAYTHK